MLTADSTNPILKTTVILLIILIAITNFAFLNAINLHPDEAYYWAWSRDLDIGYFDNSPGVAYLIRLFTSIGGNNELWVRMPAFLGWAFIIFFMFFFARKLYPNPNTSYFAVLLALFCPMLLAGSHIMTHDIPLIIFSLPAWYFLYRAIELEEKKAWLWVGIFFGLALFSKFQAVMIAFSIIVMLLFRPTKRRLLFQKGPYLAALIGFIMFLPVLYWNWQHNWAAFAWQSQHGIHQGMKFANLGQYIAGQSGTFSLLFLALLYYTIKRFFQGQGASRHDFFLIGTFGPVFAFFGFTSLTFVAAPNWPAVAYFPAILFLAGQLHQTLQNRWVRIKPLVVGFIILSCVLSTFVISLVRYPDFFVQQLKLKIPSSAIISNASYGWKPLGGMVDSILPATISGVAPARTPVFADSYQIAAELNFYVKRPISVFTTRQAHRNHYDYLTLAQIQYFNNRSGLLVLEKPLPANANQYFSGIRPVQTQVVRRFGKDIRQVTIYRFEKLNATRLYEMALHKPLGYPGTYPD